MNNRISDITRRDIFDLFREGLIERGITGLKIEYPYYGRIEELEFLERVYNLDNIPSNDTRFLNARDDIIQHTINNYDYPYCWIFQDERFQLMSGPDEVLLRFLCEVFHPYVRDEKKDWKKFFDRINEYLRADGYELYVKEYVSKRAIYDYRDIEVYVGEEKNRHEVLDLIDEFKSGLIAKATDGDLDEKDYKRCRDTLMNDPSITTYIPAFIKSNRTAADFRRYMQGQAEHYVDRRRLITFEMDKLYQYLDTSEDPFMQMKEYKKLERLGQGGYGQVFRYHNDCLDMDFAVKIYDPVFVSNEEQLEGEKRFFREAKLLLSLSNNHIVRIYDAGRLDGKPYIRMELINGYDLVKLHDKEGNLDFSRSAIAIYHILLGMKYAHEHGIVHRDLKPSNVVYSTTERLLKIIDFGVSAFLDTEGHTKLTRTGEMVAGGIYIDPLLQETPKLRDVRSDIYSIGAIWYYLLCGSAPSGSNMREYLLQSNMELSDAEADVVMKCLSKRIEDRYNSCAQLIEVIQSMGVLTKIV